jgi:hypothetical protein
MARSLFNSDFCKKLQVKFIYPVLFLLIYGLTSCLDKKDTPYEADNIYFDYRIRGQEGNDNLAIRAQFREEDEEGEAIPVRPPGLVSIDGDKLQADSTKMDGYYYETFKPIQSFAGKHAIIYTDINKKEYREEFEFRPFSISADLPDTLRRNDMEITLEGVNDGEKVTVILIDTSFENGITRKDEVYNNQVLLTAEDLGELANGPVQLELIHEIDIPVKNGTKAGGRVSIVFSVKKEFVLAD